MVCQGKGGVYGMFVPGLFECLLDNFLDDLILHCLKSTIFLLSRPVSNASGGPDFIGGPEDVPWMSTSCPELVGNVFPALDFLCPRRLIVPWKPTMAFSGKSIFTGFSTAALPACWKVARSGRFSVSTFQKQTVPTVPG